ncbi:hypothetical protein [Streptomyces sp. NPDC045470]|uniref:hypothetical protein n=1 Tax=Streptomyces sp. NPDC045470 TaxID=3155469 RepID=UPI0033D5853F
MKAPEPLITDRLHTGQPAWVPRWRLGVTVEPGQLLLMHWQPPRNGAVEEHTYVGNAPVIRSGTVFRFTPDGEVLDARFVPRKQLSAYVPEDGVERVDAALEALSRGRPCYLAGRAR